MAAKRLRDYSDEEQDDQPGNEKRIRQIPSLSTVVREAIMAKSLQNLFYSLEPLLRRVVKEEVEHVLVRSSQSLQRMCIEAPVQSTLKLVFVKSLSVPIFTGSKIEDLENNPLQIILVDTSGGQVSLPSALKLEVVVLDGDFQAGGDTEDWTSADFQNKIVKERTGRRPLLTGDVSITLRDGSACIVELCFTDNSSWIRSRNFRIGVRIVPGSYDGPRIKEAVTEPFMVKDHRGESTETFNAVYRKHYPPALGDEVWRLERIGKDGAFHRKLAAEKINTVQDFLKLWVVDPIRLRNILGVGMSERMWEGTLSHAKTCELGSKFYLHQAAQLQCTLVLNPICEVVQIHFPDNISCTIDELSKPQKSCVKQLVQEAYNNWGFLEETEGYYSQNLAITENVQVPQMEIESLHGYQGAIGCYQNEGSEGLDFAQPFYG